MSRTRRCEPVPLEIRETASLLERRWQLSILYAALSGALRFNEFAEAVAFSARMTPMRANIVGPPRSATSMSASIAACHSGSAASFFGRPVTYVAASGSVRSLRPFAKAIGSSKRAPQGTNDGPSPRPDFHSS